VFYNIIVVSVWICIYIILLLYKYLVHCVSYAFNITVVSDGIYSINLGGLQADLKGGVGAAAPPEKR